MPDQAPDATQPVTNTPDSSVPNTADQQPLTNQAPPASTPDSGDDVDTQSAPASPQALQAQQQPTQTAAQPGTGTGTVTNTPATSMVVNKSIQRAGILHQIAQTLAGGPRYTTSIDPTTGQTTRTQLPMSRADIGMAIVAEVLSGSMAGLSATPGPGVVGRAAAAGYQQAQAQAAQQKQQEQQQAEEDVKQQTTAFARAAQIFETNSRTALNTSEVEQRGADAIDKLVAINRQSGVFDIDPSGLDNNGQPVTQDELIDGMKTGKYSSTDQLGPLAGRVEVTNPDGSKRWEGTHIILKDPSTPTTISQDDWNRYADAGIPGFRKGVVLGPGGATVKLSMKQNANEVVAAHYLANQRLTDLRNTLSGTTLADKVPTSIDFTKPGVETAIQRFQRYVSHNSDNLADPYTALQQMGADKRDPKTGEMQPNPDARYVSTVMDAMGGPSVLLAAHNQLAVNKADAEKYSIIDTPDKATAVLAAPKGRFTQAQIASAQNYFSLSKQMGESKAASEVRARAIAEGTDVEAMYKFGKNPITGDALTLQNAPDAMLVSSSGQVIPQTLVSTYKPTAQERQTADTARQVLSISQNLRQAIAANPNLSGPLSGRSKQALSKAGVGDAQAQTYLDDLSFLTSAATKMHTGRFSNEVLKKMDNLIFPGMNPGQFGGALDSINSVAQRYADEDRLVSVGEYKAQQTQAATAAANANARRNATPAPLHVVPAGATVGRDPKTKAIIGYRTADGKTVTF